VQGLLGAVRDARAPRGASPAGPVCCILAHASKIPPRSNPGHRPVFQPGLGRDHGAGAQRVSTEIRASRYKRYRVTLEPTAAAPQDRYRKASTIVRVAADTASKSVRLNLGINRWNVENVNDVWEDKGIDPARARDVAQAQLFGRRITINRLVLPRIERTNALFAALPADTQQEIRESIAILGGYARRTTSKGTYSNHSIGCGVDINYNMDTRQNFHFESRVHREHRDHLVWVQEIIRTDPAHRDFAIFRSTGQAQWEGAQAFNRRFPLYLAELLDLQVPRLTPEAVLNPLGSVPAMLAQVVRDYGTGEILDKVTIADLDKAIKDTSDVNKKAKLRKVKQYWPYTRAWIRGSMVDDVQARTQKKLVGMIPIHEQLLQVFLDAGWSWGGDWQETKDYMHFEDLEAMAAVKRSEG
jgi:hypothetical protein